MGADLQARFSILRVRFITINNHFYCYYSSLVSLSETSMNHAIYKEQISKHCRGSETGHGIKELRERCFLSLPIGSRLSSILMKVTTMPHGMKNDDKLCCVTAKVKQ